MAWQDHLCAFVQEYERRKPKQHPVGITAEGGDQDNAELFATCADWISPSNGRLFEYRYNPPAAAGRKVILIDTDHLWGHGGEVGWVWKSFTRGMNMLFMDPWEPIPADMPGWVRGSVSLNRRYYHVWDPLRRNLGYARRFALRMDLDACVPHEALCTSSYCLANPGQEYLCFFPSGGHEGVDRVPTDAAERQGDSEAARKGAEAPVPAPGDRPPERASCSRGNRARAPPRVRGPQFAVEWFNPATGKTVNGGEIAGGRRHALGAPFPGAAVLYLRKKDP